MKPFITTAHLARTPAFIKFTTFTLFSISLFIIANRYVSFSYSPLSFFSTFTTSSLPPVTLPAVVHDAAPAETPATPPKPLKPPAMEWTGIVDVHGVMAEEFQIGEFDPGLLEEVTRSSEDVERRSDGGDVRVKVDKFEECKRSMQDYIPCLDNVEAIKRFNSSERGEKYERHCPGQGKGLNCLLPSPKGYERPISWPLSRDEIWFNNVPRTHLVDDKGDKNWIAVKKNKFIFSGDGTQSIHRADEYINQIAQMVPDIAFGQYTQIALDIDCGVANFGAFLLQHNVTTLSIAPKDVHENQIQFALERGVPAMVAVFGTRRLLYPSQAFELIHCSKCRINWTRDDGILLLEANRILRAGGYFVWAAQPVEEILHEQWKEMEDLTQRICWKLVKKEGQIAIWQKPLNNSCYLNRDAGVQPPLCDSTDDPDNVWYAGLKACITRLPDNNYGANVTSWPARLHDPPERLHSIVMDAITSRNEIFKAEAKFWHDVIEGYVIAFHWKEFGLRNVLDMRAGFGGFAAALRDFEIDCWVMNVVPVSGFNTLPVIYDRGLVGVMHDWCEPFDTYPRTYDLLHAAGLFSIERKRCNMSTIILEMDRILRPGGRAYIRDSVSVIDELQEIASAVGWVPALHDSGEGPHSSYKILICDKRRT